MVRVHIALSMYNRLIVLVFVISIDIEPKTEGGGSIDIATHQQIL